MPYQSLEIDGLRYLLVEDDGSHTLVLKKENGGFVRVPLGAGGGDGGGAALDAHAEDDLLHSSGIELAYVENVSATKQTVPTVATLVTGLTMIVPASERPVWVEASIMIDITAVGAAGASCNYTLFVAPAPEGPVHAIVNDFAVGGAGTAGEISLCARGRIDPEDLDEPLTLNAYMFQAATAGFTGDVRHGNPAGYLSYLTAFAR